MKTTEDAEEIDLVRNSDFELNDPDLGFLCVLCALCGFHFLTDSL